jgi:aminoglycoside 6'-N-acetyltransferase
MLLTGLETPRLVIRDVCPSDVDAFFAYMKREQYWQDLPIDPPTVASIKAMVDRCLSDQGKEPRTDFFLAAVAKATGDLVGEAILHIRSLRWRQGEIGWGVSSDHVGHGLATEIGIAMLHLAFDSFSLHRVLCSVPGRESGFPPNNGQARHARRGGLARERSCSRCVVVVNAMLDFMQ